MATDLTKGSPLKQILYFSIPYLIGNLFQQFYNLADMVIVGRTISPEAYAAVGSTGSIVTLTIGSISAMSVGFSTVIARHVGANDKDTIKRSFASAIKLSAVIALLLTALCLYFLRPMLELLRTPPDIIDRSQNYLFWLFAGIVFTTLYNLLANVIRALGDSKTPLYFLIVACVVNIILDFVLIAVLGMDTDGAGLATVIAQLVAGICCIVYIRKRMPALHISRCHFARNGVQGRELLRLGIPQIFLNAVVSVGSIMVQFVTNGLGTDFVSAQATGGKIEAIVILPIVSIGSSVTVFTAQNFGAKKYDRVLAGGKAAMLLGLIFCTIASLIMIPFGKGIVTLLMGKEVEMSVILNAYRYVVVHTALSMILVILIVFKDVLLAAGRTFWTMVSGFTEIAGRVGVSFAAMFIINAAIVTDQEGFFFMCFTNAAAWLLGTLTVVLDYAFLMRKLRRMSDEQTAKNVEAEAEIPAPIS